MEWTEAMETAVKNQGGRDVMNIIAFPLPPQCSPKESKVFMHRFSSQGWGGGAGAVLRCKNRGSWVPSSQTEALVESFESRGRGKGVG